MAENVLTREVAGIPVGVWGIVVVGGLGIAYYINSSQSGPEPRPEPITEPGVGTGLVPAGAAIVPGGQQEEQGFENNAQWGNAAKAFLIGQGHNPTVADNAVRKYLVAEQLTQQENGMIQQVLASGVGIPPEDLPPSPPVQEQPEGAPQLIFDDHHRTARRFTTETIEGRVMFGDEPAGIQLITAESWYPGYKRMARRWIVASNANGEFSTRVGGWGGKGTQHYRFKWKGNVKEVHFRVS